MRWWRRTGRRTSRFGGEKSLNLGPDPCVSRGYPGSPLPASHYTPAGSDPIHTWVRRAPLWRLFAQ